MNRPGYDIRHLRPIKAEEYETFIRCLVLDGFSSKAVAEIIEASKKVTVDQTNERLVLVPQTWV